MHCRGIRVGWARSGLKLALPILGIIALPVDLAAEGSKAQAALHIQVTVVNAVPSSASLNPTSAPAVSVTIPTPSFEVKVETRQLLSNSGKEENRQGRTPAVLETVTVVAQ